jgi:thiol peroxidase
VIRQFQEYDQRMTTKFKGSEVHLQGALPKLGEPVPNIRYVGADLADKQLADLKGRVVVLFSVPSVDTGVCAAETRAFNQKLAGNGAAGVVISADLPFALKRFCGAEGIDNVQPASDFRFREMDKLGVRMADGHLAGLLARVVFVLDKEGVLRYTQVVPEVTTEPDYDAVLAEVAKLA